MKRITTAVRLAAKQLGLHQPQDPIFSDLITGRKLTAGYQEVRSVKLGFTKMTPTQVIAMTRLIEADGLRVISHYHNKGGEYNGIPAWGVWGQRFIVGRPNPEPVPESPLRVDPTNGVTQ